MITRNTPFSEFMEALREALKTPTVCQPAQVWCDFESEKLQDCVLGDMVDRLKLKDFREVQPWAAGVLGLIGNNMDSISRMDFMFVIKDPMVAFMLYTRIKNLTDEEDTILEKVFKGKIPVAEKELLDGIITSKKVR